jgi:predicted transcriptional regulator
MILNFEIDDHHGERLDELARRERRSRRAQATKLFLDALELVVSVRNAANQPATEESVR